MWRECRVSPRQTKEGDDTRGIKGFPGVLLRTEEVFYVFIYSFFFQDVSGKWSTRQHTANNCPDYEMWSKPLKEATASGTWVCWFRFFFKPVFKQSTLDDSIILLLLFYYILTFSVTPSSPRAVTTVSPVQFEWSITFNCGTIGPIISCYTFFVIIIPHNTLPIHHNTCSALKVRVATNY